MRHLLRLYIIVVFIFLNSSTYAQEIYNKSRRFIDSLDNATGTVLMTDPGLNVFMAKKVNTYLTGTGDLSLNKSYFIIDPTDGRLFIGTNHAKDPSSGDGRTKWVFTGGIKMNVADAFSIIYSGEDNKLKENIGAVLKLTLLGRGIISYDANRILRQQKNLVNLGLDSTGQISYTDQEAGEYLRRQVKNQIYAEMKEDSTDFINSLSGLIDDEQAQNWAIKKLDDHIKKQNKKYRSAYITREADNIDEEGMYNWFWNHWLSLNIYVPFTKQPYEVSEDFTSPIVEKKLYNIEAGLLYNHILEKEKIRLFISLGGGLKNHNNIITSSLKKHSINDYRNLGGVDTLKLAQLQAKDVYIGNYTSYFTPFTRFQIVSFFLAEKSIGLSFSAEKYMKGYDPLNIKLGIPFTLTGKDKDTKANFEIQLKWNDYNNNFLTNKSRSDKFTLGFSVGVPLTSKIY
ncbi:hypothetical protein [Pontibacter sp. SGAir0037]|uniref:hypothetical protein n=1 Tax=Pontibacter sp. SGAir0037 TaxID=2571030 RepID=UPI0010CCF0AC|nr:hypothetical protein [Pontibacter sp. SGAir0037]QCR24510.1 hypothetical protein C1N53_20540 [Pontibacter sp. SGAir0037]